MATRRSVIGMGKLAIAACFAYACGLFVFAFAHSLASAVPVLLALGRPDDALRRAAVGGAREQVVVAN